MCVIRMSELIEVYYPIACSRMQAKANGLRAAEADTVHMFLAIQPSEMVRSLTESKKLLDEARKDLKVSN